MIISFYNQIKRINKMLNFSITKNGKELDKSLNKETGYNCTFKTCANCPFNILANCTFITSSDCIFKTGYGKEIVLSEESFNKFKRATKIILDSSYYL
jgi:hypothetical protein